MCPSLRGESKTNTPTTPSLRGSKTTEAIHKDKIDCHADKSARNDESNNLPKSWQVKTLGEMCEKISAGGDIPNDCTAEKTQENQIPIFSKRR